MIDIDESGLPTQSALDNINDYAIVLNRQGAIVRFNKACTQLTDPQFKKGCNQPVWDVLRAPLGLDPVKKVFAPLLGELSQKQIKTSWISEHGDQSLITWSNHTLCNDNGAVEFILSTGTNRPLHCWQHHEPPVTPSYKLEEEWEQIFNAVHDAVTIHDLQHNILYANQAAKKLLDLPLRQQSWKKCYEYFHGTTFAPAGCTSCQTLKTGKPNTSVLFEPKLNKHVEIKALPKFDKNKKLHGVIHIVRDIDAQKKAETEQKKLQAQLIQSQKMECVGRLAGGVAHDFNNILTTILGYCEFSIIDLPPDSPLRENLQIIYDSAEKAAGLTKQLLTFSRKQLLDMELLDLNVVIANMAKMMRRLIGEDINLYFKEKENLKRVKADLSQLQQILMNLAVNARDAMPEGGDFAISLSEITLREPYSTGQETITPGRYIVMTVKDNGAGIPPETRDKIFEPFFTTKEIGKGTGLGLATVYGIIKQHQGFITVNSKASAGTTFTIYLPAHTTTLHAKDLPPPANFQRGAETVLVAEDDQNIRQLIVEVLKGLGYKVLAASNGQEALNICNSYKEEIHLLLTDVIMPDINGRKLADTTTVRRQGMKVIYMSGYTDDFISQHGVLAPDVPFLQKPLTPMELATKVRTTLDESR